MYTHIAKCTGNFIRVPEIITEKLKMRVPVIITRQEYSDLLVTDFELPLKTKGIKDVKTKLNYIKFNMFDGGFSFNGEIIHEVYFILNKKVMYQEFSEQFSGYLSIEEVNEKMYVCYTCDFFEIPKLIGNILHNKTLINLNLEILELRDIPIP